MGKISKGILGGVSGKIGNVVGANWIGIDYLRTMPASVSNPNTAAQVAQRTKFATVLNFLQPLTSIIRIGYAAFAVKMTAFNAAFSQVIGHAITGTSPNWTIDYTKVLLTRGNLENAPDASAASATAGTVTLTWDPALYGYLSALTDNVLAVVFNPTKNQAAYSMNLATREDGTLDITVPSIFSGDTVHVYLSFASAASLYTIPDRNQISTSLYAGSVLVS